MRPIVIVGASLAGLRAATAVRAAGWAGRVVLVGDEPHKPYTRPPLSKEVLDGRHTVETGAFPCEELDVEWRLGEPATALDVAARTVTIGDEAVEYETLIIATGTRARTWPGETAANVFTLRDRDDAIALKAALATAKTVAIVGAGFIGCEVASSARKLGLEVTLLDVAEQPMLALGAELGARCAALHRDHGVELRLGAPADLAALDHDVIVVALGALPNIEWLEGSGLTLDRGVVCDANLQAAPHVFAAGDVAVWPHPLADGEPIRVEHWTNAAEQGAHAGRNALAETPKPYEAVPYFWTDQYDVKIQAAGLPARAERVELIEPDVAVGVRGEHVVSVVTFNAPRKLMQYRRRLASRPRLDELVSLA
ncbi:FAD-dependent oxidoreductase [Solirubrobacter ginsenosidimutans]|uniref:FAD-dependent oxidoreductase n=1 Tax=Solirubrobacter ginsenosidimutans TaxID=490573 RepID=A0A9X3RZK7_9ACTN|nr:FAD-dependent oxidoreductase [Solirubrobacter ginsenosidimutans]MDA0160995.1 FAD-dependent oxidoreductase [Solirubrobacter ginsenosidimutans]